MIAYRRVREKLVYREAEALLPTQYGTGRIIAYGVKYELQQPMVFVMGDLEKVAAPLVRLHSSCFTGDLLESLRCDCGDQLHMALDMIATKGPACWSICRKKAAGLAWSRRSRRMRCKTRGSTLSRRIWRSATRPTRAITASASSCSRTSACAKVRLLTNNPKKTDAFIYGGFDLEVVDQIPIVPPMNEHNVDYIATKRDKMGHHLPRD